MLLLGIVLIVIGTAMVLFFVELYCRGIDAQLQADLADLERDGGKTRARIRQLNYPHLYPRSSPR